MGFVLLWVLSGIQPIGAEETPPQQALRELMEGNQRFVAGKSVHRDLSQEALVPLRQGQTPKAVIVGCSDSRVSPEVIFDQGLGDLFVVRVAGNVIGPIELESIVFGVQQLKAPLILVLGHENCAAVKGAMQSVQKPKELAQIFSLIALALKSCNVHSENGLTDAIWCNALAGVRSLRSTATLKPFLDAQKLEVKGAYYEFQQGAVKIIPETGS